MPKRNCTDEEAIKIDFVVAWAMFKSKMGVSNIAKRFGVCLATVYNWVKKVDDVVKDKIDMEELKAAALLCYPLALDSLAYNLRDKKDPSVTNNFLNKTIWGDVKDSESHSQTNVFNLGAGFDQSIGQADTELLKEIRDRLRNGNREAGTPAVVSRIKGSS